MKGIHAISEMNAGEIERLLSLATEFKSGKATRKNLSGRTVALFFSENSTRTKLSFTLAAQKLGARVLDLNESTSSVAKGESLLDTSKTLEAMGADCIVIRHQESGITRYLQQHLQIPIVNAGDGWSEHPSQCLLDLLTISEYKKFAGLKVVIAGDILHSRVARSDAEALRKLGATVSFTGPKTLMPPKTEKAPWPESLKATDVLVLLRIQKERQDQGLLPSLSEYHKLYGLTAEYLEMLPTDSLILHPGPVNRGVELADAVLENPRCKILNQVENGVFARMALLYAAIEGRNIFEIPA
jgi:aspartate carbamoyltransferase catalytic subunit